MDRLLTVREAAEKLNCHPHSVYRLVESNEIPHIKRPGIGLRFNNNRLEEWLDKSTKKASQNALNMLVNQQFGLTLPPIRRIVGSDGKPKGGTGEMAKYAKSATRLNLGYGAVYQRISKQGAIRWYLDYLDKGGKRVQRVAKHAQSAEEAAIELRQEVADVFRAVRGLETEKKPINFSEFTDTYMKDYARVNKRSWQSDEYRLRALKPYFGEYSLQEITPQYLERFRSERIRAGEAKSTVNRRMALLKRMFNLAIDWGHLKENPVSKIRFFSEKENERTRVLTDAEEGRLLSASDELLRPLIQVALHTGMRRGEILNMRWADVDLAKNDIRIPHSKSGRPRYVPINQTLRRILAGLRAQDPNGMLVFPSKRVRTAFETACEKAQIEGFTFHDLRRTFGTRLLERGVNIVTISRYYGHSSVLVTQRYLHPRDDLNREAVERLNSAGAYEPEKAQNPLHPCDTEESAATEGPLNSSSTVN